jgi:hypothetical protein
VFYFVVKRQKPEAQVLALTPIRIERELSRFPIHNLARQGSIRIEIRGTDRAGKDFHWRVSPSRDYGEPKELAYKLDSLVINRRIEQAGKKKPKLIRLGSLRSICRDLGINEGQGSQRIKQALMQNASAFITAKFSYRTVSGLERNLEAGFNRYSVIFTGERLPDGREADAVYVLLSDIFLEILNSVGTRPLDYDYLKALPPSSQRFYELVSPQVFAALKYNLSSAKYLYSDWCIYSGTKRYYEWDKAKKQLYKVLKPHKDSGYIASVSFESTADSKGEKDWVISLVPGTKAEGEFERFFSNKEAFPKSSRSSKKVSDEALEELPIQETLFWDLAMAGLESK